MIAGIEPCDGQLKTSRVRYRNAFRLKVCAPFRYYPIFSQAQSRHDAAGSNSHSVTVHNSQGVLIYSCAFDHYYRHTLFFSLKVNVIIIIYHVIRKQRSSNA